MCQCLDRVFHKGKIHQHLPLVIHMDQIFYDVLLNFLLEAAGLHLSTCLALLTGATLWAMIHHQLSEIVTICQLLEVLNRYHGFGNRAASNMDTVGSLRTLEVIQASWISTDPTVCTISSYIDRQDKADFPRLKVVLIPRYVTLGSS